MRERWAKIALAGLGIALMAMAWHHGTRQSGGITPVGSRRQMPSLVLAQLDGGTWRMEEHRGQVVLINYWASWCGPCWEETPGLIRLSKDEGPKGLAVVGVSLDHGDRAKVRQFVEEFHLPYPVAFPGPMSEMADEMIGLPTTVLVDRNGLVAKTYVGAVREGDFREDVEVLLGEHGGR